MYIRPGMAFSVTKVLTFGLVPAFSATFRNVCIAVAVIKDY